MDVITETAPEKNGTARIKPVPRRAPSQAAKEAEIRFVTIPKLNQGEITVTVIGDRPLLVNNKMNVAEAIADRYSGAGKAAAVSEGPVSTDQQYINAFYVMPDSPHEPPHPKGHYGIPASGIKKCVCAAIRTTGITDNTTIGLISNSFWIMEDGAGLCRLKFDKLEHDIRAVNIGSGQKTVPRMAHRPMFHGWKVDVRVKFNQRVLTPEAIINLFQHAGQYIGLHELRAQKKQGMCGGFFVKCDGVK